LGRSGILPEATDLAACASRGGSRWRGFRSNPLAYSRGVSGSGQLMRQAIVRISTGHSLVMLRFLKNGDCACGGSASPETMLPTPTTRAPAPRIVSECYPRRRSPLRLVQGTRSAQYLNSHHISTHRKNSISRSSQPHRDQTRPKMSLAGDHTLCPSGLSNKLGRTGRLARTRAAPVSPVHDNLRLVSRLVYLQNKDTRRGWRSY
jgi:hypothetical protein